MINKIEVGNLKIAGLDTASVLHTLKPFLGVKNNPDFSLLSKPVQVYLDKTALQIEGYKNPEHGTLVLNLEDERLLSLISNKPLRVRWFCQNDPRDYIGPMFNHYRGTYFRHYCRELIYSDESATEVYLLSKDIELNWQIAVATCIAREGGVPESQVRKTLKLWMKN